jgi:hypothetical protein
MPKRQQFQLSAPEQQVEAGFDTLVKAQTDACVFHYLTRFGRFIDTDMAREFCPEYRTDAAGRTQWSRATYKPAKWLSEQVYLRLLGSVRFWDKRARIIFTSGGSGAGKTTARLALWEENLVSVPSPEDREIGLVVDGTLSNFEHAQQQIVTAMADGHTVAVLHVDVNFEDAVRRVIERAVQMGRVVTLENLAKNHEDARATFLRLIDAFGESVEFHVVRLLPTGEPEVIAPSALLRGEEMAFDRLRERAFSVFNNEFQGLATSHSEIWKALQQPGSRVKA